jgi:hypothetical protein
MSCAVCLAAIWLDPSTIHIFENYPSDKPDIFGIEQVNRNRLITSVVEVAELHFLSCRLLVS